MSWSVIVITLTVISILEAASHNYVKLLGVSPEIVLVGVLFLALNSDKKKGAITGMIGGLLKITFSGMHPLLILLYGLIGFVAGLYKEALYRHLAYAQMIMTAIAVISTTLIYDVMISSRGFPYYKAAFFLSMPATIYTSLISPVIFKILGSIIPSVELDYREIMFKKKVYEERRPQ